MCEHTPWEFTAAAKNLICRGHPAPSAEQVKAPGPARGLSDGDPQSSALPPAGLGPREQGLWVTAPGS